MNAPQGMSSSKEKFAEINEYSARTNSAHILSPAGSILAREILFACSNCDGPLVPASTCIICKKTEQRKCLHCNFTRSINEHGTCKQLLLLGVQFHLTQKVEVNQ